MVPLVDRPCQMSLRHRKQRIREKLTSADPKMSHSKPMDKPRMQSMVDFLTHVSSNVHLQRNKGPESLLFGPFHLPRALRSLVRTQTKRCPAWMAGTQSDPSGITPIAWHQACRGLCKPRFPFEKPWLSRRANLATHQHDICPKEVQKQNVRVTGIQSPPNPQAGSQRRHFAPT